MTLRTALELGRVSSLPTVWTNVLAGVALSALEPAWKVVPPVGLAASLLYVGGRYLDAAFDRGPDARAERLVPRGEVSTRRVFHAGFARAGFGMMAAALVILAVATTAATFVAGLVLAGLILLYDVSHKGNRFAPAVTIAIMGLGRVAVYGVAASASGRTFAPPVIVGAAFLFLYLVMLSMIAREENQAPKSPRLVGRLIAGISLVDGVQLLVVGQPWVALGCVGAFFLTLGLQRRLADT